jgi:hypothetical protein
MSMSWIRSHRPSPTAIVAVLALTGALAGTAIASNPTAPSGKVSKSRVKKIAQKQIDKTLGGPLRSGVSLHGTWAFAGRTQGGGSASESVAETAISFPVPLASTPSFHVVSSGPTTNCPGTVSHPKARRGNLCLYEQTADGFSSINTEVSNRFGVTIFGSGIGANSNYNGNGTWAVRAP